MRFLTKISFILNICFLVAVSLRYMPHLPDEDIFSLIIVAGYVLAMVANVTMIVWLSIFLIRERSLPPFIPKWILISNFLIFVCELIFFFL